MKRNRIIEIQPFDLISNPISILLSLASRFVEKHSLPLALVRFSFAQRNFPTISFTEKAHSENEILFCQISPFRIV